MAAPAAAYRSGALVAGGGRVVVDDVVARCGFGVIDGVDGGDVMVSAMVRPTREETLREGRVQGGGVESSLALILHRACSAPHANGLVH